VGDPTAAGEDALDVEALKQVAQTTGGIYAHAVDRPQLDAIYRKLDAMETHQAETVSQRPRRDIYWQPLALGLAISALEHIFLLTRRAWRRRRVTLRAVSSAPGAARSSEPRKEAA
jgi:Ca-activated chloride channel family protein